MVPYLHELLQHVAQTAGGNCAIDGPAMKAMKMVNPATRRAMLLKTCHWSPQSSVEEEDSWLDKEVVETMNWGLMNSIFFNVVLRPSFKPNTNPD